MEADAAPAVTAVHAQRGDPRLGAAFVPADRVSARAFASFDEATVITIPRGDRGCRADCRLGAGRGRRGGGVRAHADRGRGQREGRRRAGPRRVSATYADNVEIVVGDGAALTVVSLQDWADDAVHVSHHYVTAGPGRAAAAHGGDAGRERGAAGAVGAVRRARGRCRAAGGCTSPTPGSTWSTGCSWTTRSRNCRSRVEYKGALQGDERAHGVDRRRADPGGGDRDRHLRAEPEPAADRGRPGGLGAEPGDPHRRGGRAPGTRAPAGGWRTTTCST